MEKIVIIGHTECSHLLLPIPEKDKLVIVKIEEPEEPKLPPEDVILNFKPSIVENGIIYPKSSPKDYGYKRANRKH